MLRRAATVLTAVLACAVAAGCGAAPRQAVPSPPSPAAAVTTTAVTTAAVLAARPPACAAGAVRPLVTARHAYAAVASHGAVALTRPGGSVLARFGPVNVNRYPTILGVRAERVGSDCRARWYRVQLPVKPNGATGWVRASSVSLANVPTRILVSLSQRRLTLLENGRVVLRSRVAVGSPSTPTPTGSYYVNQLLVPDDPGGPYGPGALGISAYSNVLTGWTQGGPVAIHGTNEPWSIGRAVSNGCIRLPNATLRRVFKIASAGTPVIISH